MRFQSVTFLIFEIISSLTGQINIPEGHRCSCSEAEPYIEDCITLCYLMAEESDNEVCNVTTCPVELSDYFTLLGFQESWLQIEARPSDGSFTFGLNSDAASALSFDNQLDYTCIWQVFTEKIRRNSCSGFYTDRDTVAQDDCFDYYLNPNNSNLSIISSGIFNSDNTSTTVQSTQNNLDNTESLGVLIVCSYGTAQELTWQRLQWPMEFKVQSIYAAPSEPFDLKLQFSYSLFGLFQSELRWSSPENWHGSPRYYEARCRFILPLWFDDPRCSTCLLNGSNCLPCWEADLEMNQLMMEERISWRKTYFNFTVSYRIYEKRNGTFIPRTTSGDLEKNLTNLPADINVDQYPFEDPTSSAFETIILCRVRAVNSFLLGTWSQLLVIPLAESFAHQSVTLNLVRDLTPLSVSERLQEIDDGNKGALAGAYGPTDQLYSVMCLDVSTMKQCNDEKQTLGPMPFFLQNTPFGTQQLTMQFHSESDTKVVMGGICLNWIIGQFFFVSAKNSTLWIASGPWWMSSSETDEYFIAERKHMPVQIECHSYHSSIYWTESDANHTQLFYGKIKQTDFSGDQSELGLDITEVIINIEKKGTIQLVSSAISTLTKEREQMLLVITAEGLVAVYNNDPLVSNSFTFEILVPLAKMNQYHLEDIYSITITVDSIYFLSSTSPGIHHISLSDLVLISTTVVLRAPIPVTSKMLEYLPYYSGTVYRRLDLRQESSLSIVASQTYSELPPIRCIFARIANVTFTMIKETIGELTVVIAWEQLGLPCTLMGHPMVRFDVRYIAITELEPRFQSYDFNCTLEFQCPMDSIPAPYKVVPAINSYNTTVGIALNHLKEDQLHLIEAKATSVLATEVTNYFPDQQPYRTVQIVKAKYTRPQSVLTKVLPGTLVPMMVLIGALTLLWLILWRKKWYMYRSLKRLGRGMFHWQEKLGEGHFCEVWKATLREAKKSTTIVAVKQLKLSATELERRQFLEEAILISKLSHPNIIAAVGICMESKPILLALEFINGGSLEHYLRDHNKAKQRTQQELVQICLWTGRGCAYLEKQGYVHRDIAARNCLIKLNNSGKPTTVKLADFGLAKDVSVHNVYQIGIGQAVTLPLAYSAPEAFSGSFSFKSDVWSFGVLLWEVFTNGAVPFKTWAVLDAEHRQVIITRWIQQDKKTLLDMNDPVATMIPNKVKDIMKACWNYDPEGRPTFGHPVDRQSVTRMLGQILQNGLTLMEVPVMELHCHSNGLTVMEVPVMELHSHYNGLTVMEAPVMELHSHYNGLTVMEEELHCHSTGIPALTEMPQYDQHVPQTSLARTCYDTTMAGYTTNDIESNISPGYMEMALITNTLQ